MFLFRLIIVKFNKFLIFNNSILKLKLSLKLSKKPKNRYYKLTEDAGEPFYRVFSYLQHPGSFT